MVCRTVRAVEVFVWLAGLFCLVVPVYFVWVLLFSGLKFCGEGDL